MIAYGKIGRVRDIGEGLELLTDSQDVEAVGAYLGEDTSEFGSMFVRIGDGEYTEIYGCWKNAPGYDALVERLL